MLLDSDAQFRKDGDNIHHSMGNCKKSNYYLITDKLLNQLHHLKTLEQAAF